jgi:hypothetical protein
MQSHGFDKSRGENSGGQWESKIRSREVKILDKKENRNFRLELIADSHRQA